MAESDPYINAHTHDMSRIRGMGEDSSSYPGSPPKTLSRLSSSSRRLKVQQRNRGISIADPICSLSKEQTPDRKTPLLGTVAAGRRCNAVSLVEHRYKKFGTAVPHE